MGGSLVKVDQSFVDTSLDRSLLVALANQTRDAGTLDEIFESLHGVWINPLAVAGASECHLAWLHEADNACGQHC